MAHEQESEAELDLVELNAELASYSAEELIRWAVERFAPRLVVSSSFGAHSALVLHMVHRVAPNLPILWIDTGYLFPETYRFAHELKERFRLNLQVYAPSLSAAYQEALYGRLWEQGEEGVRRYLQLNKLEPMQRALREHRAQAWIAGLRGDQTEHRRALRKLELQDGRYKIHPILDWDEGRVDEYLHRHSLPYHPLHGEGYRSIGDWHSTLPTLADQDPREGRILGQKRECGLHLPISPEQDASLRSSAL